MTPLNILACVAMAAFVILASWGEARLRRPRYGMDPSADDPHQHCDRHPIRCTYARTIARYRDLAEIVAVCPNCTGCAHQAKAVLAPNYEPD